VDATIVTVLGSLGPSAAAVAVMYICWKMMLTMAERWAKESERNAAQYAALFDAMITAIKDNGVIMTRLEAAISERQK
jgi:hypothetical protein